MRSILQGLLLLGCAFGALAQGFVEGTHYNRLAQVQPTISKDKVEVLEAFSYGCVHCAHFEPLVEAWLPRMPKQAQFVRFPVAWNAPYELYARGFFTAQALGILEKSHAEMFRAIYARNERHNSLEDLAKFYSAYGIKPEAFLAAANSFGVSSKIKRIQQQTPRYEVDGTPTVIVAGKYRVTIRPGAPAEETLKIVDFLVQKELIERAAPVPVPAKVAAPAPAIR